jgi:hypothetical protein
VAFSLEFAMSIYSERRISLTELARREGVNPSTVWRWSLRGCRGVMLETISVGSRRFCTEAAWQRFCEATTAIAQGKTPSREAEIASAERKVKELGG